MSSATIGALKVSLGLDSAQFTGGLTKAQAHLKKAGAGLERIGGQMQGVGTALSVGVTAPLALVATQMAKTAIDAEEMQSAFDVSFGSMAKSTKAWAETTGDALGRSTTELQQAALTMHGLFKAGGPATEQTRKLAEQFAVLAQDLSSFHNVDAKTALDSLRAGLSGEAEPLRKFNVYLNEAAVKAEAMRLGLVGLDGALTESGKIQARASLIMKGTAEAQGDVARTSESTANQIRRSQAAFEELSVTIGSKIIPAITPLVKGLGDALTAFGNMPAPVQTAALAFAGVAAAIGPIVAIAGAATTAIGVMLPLLAGLAPVLLPIGVAVGAVAVAFLLFRDQIVPALKVFGATLQEVVGPKIGPLFEAFKGVVAALGEVFGAVFGGSGEASVALNWFAEHAARTIGAIVDLMTGALKAVGEIIKAFAALFRGDFAGAFEAVGHAVQAFVKGFSNAFATLFPNVAKSVQDTYQAVKTWLVDKLGGIMTAVADKAKAVGDAFFKLYDRVVGHSYVPDMVEGVAEWFGKLDGVMVAPAVAANDNVGDAFEETAHRVQSAAEEMQDAFNDVGSSLDGLVNSLKSGDINGAIRSIGSTASSLKNAFAKGSSTASKVGAGAAVADLAGQAIGGTAGAGISGAAGGALAGFAVAGPVGAVVGGLLGGIAGIFGSSKAKKEKKRQEAAAKAEEARRKAEEEAARLLAIANEKRSLEINLMLAQGNASGALAAARKLELEATDESNRSLLEQLHALEDIATRREYEIRVMEALGDSAGALAARRQQELDATDDTYDGMLKIIYAAEDMKAAADKAQEATEALNEEADDRVSAARDALSDAYDREAEALQSTIDKFRDFASSLRDFRESLEDIDTGRSGSLAQISNEFQRLAALSKLGNVEALGSIQGAGEKFRDASAAQSRTLIDYLRNLGQIRAGIQGAEDTATRTATNAEQSLAALLSQRDITLGIATQAVNINAGIASLNAAVAYQSAVQAVTNEQMLAAISQTGSTAAAVEKLRADLTAKLAEIAKTNGTTADVLQRVTRDGESMVVAA